LTFLYYKDTIAEEEKMKTIRFFELNGYKVIYGVSEVEIDPEKTRTAIAEALGVEYEDVPLLKKFNQLVEQYAKYPEPGPGELYVSDEEGVEAAAKVVGLEQHTRLTVEGETIPDWIGTKYHLKTGDTWTEAEIANIGEGLPDGAVLPEDLTADQRAEIADQKEAARIAALSPEEKTKELQARLEALADEADRLERRAKIQGMDFDSAEWYREHKEPIELKYA
jgi:hypothetical protein